MYSVSSLQQMLAVQTDIATSSQILLCEDGLPLYSNTPLKVVLSKVKE
jgi:hypothetical protein